MHCLGIVQATCITWCIASRASVEGEAKPFEIDGAISRVNSIAQVRYMYVAPARSGSWQDV